MTDSDMVDPEVFDNPGQNRYELRFGDQTAFLLYKKIGDQIRLIHTEVPAALRGTGLGSKLVEGALQLADQSGLKVVLQCPFVVEFLKRHPEYLRVVDPEQRGNLE